MYIPDLSLILKRQLLVMGQGFPQMPDIMCLIWNERCYLTLRHFCVVGRELIPLLLNQQHIIAKSILSFDLVLHKFRKIISRLYQKGDGRGAAVPSWTPDSAFVTTSNRFNKKQLAFSEHNSTKAVSAHAETTVCACVQTGLI